MLLQTKKFGSEAKQEAKTRELVPALRKKTTTANQHNLGRMVSECAGLGSGRQIYTKVD